MLGREKISHLSYDSRLHDVSVEVLGRTVQTDLSQLVYLLPTGGVVATHRVN